MINCMYTFYFYVMIRSQTKHNASELQKKPCLVAPFSSIIILLTIFLMGFTLWCLLEDSAYFDWGVVGAQLIRGQHLFEAQCLLE